MLKKRFRSSTLEWKNCQLQNKKSIIKSQACGRNAKICQPTYFFYYLDIFFSYYLIFSVMTDRLRLNTRHQNRFNYSTDLQGSNNNLNLHHKYFRMYEQFAAEANDHPQFEENRKQEIKAQSYCSEPGDKDRNVVRLLHAENKSLRTELKQNQQTIQKLKAELYRSQLEIEKLTKTTKLESYEYQSSIKELEEEIFIILEQNKSYQEENKTLKQMVRDMNGQQAKASFQVGQLKLYDRSKSQGKPYQKNHNDKQNQDDFIIAKDGKIERQEESNRKFIAGLKEMYTKIMSLKSCSLKELWRWLKGIGQMLHRLKKWRKNCREVLKQPSNKTYEKLVDFLNEAMIIID